MKTKFISLLAIILGMIIILFPILGIIGLNSLVALSSLLMSLFLLVVGVSIIDYNKIGAILDLVLGMVLLFLSLFLIFNPALIGFITEISLYFGGIMLIIVALASLINNRESKFGFYTGIIGIVLGLLYLIIGAYISNVIVLGTLLGVWLVITGILKFLDS